MDANAAFHKHATKSEGEATMSTAGLHAVLKDMSLELDFEYAKSVLASYDSDANGTLCFSEFERIFEDIMYAGKLAVPPPADVSPLVMTAFRKHDADGNGEISTKELFGILKELQLDVDSEHASCVLRKYDTDGNGNLSLTELDAVFKDALYANSLSVPPPKDIDATVLSAFRRHDVDGSGDVSHGELFAMLKEMGVDQDAPHAQKVLGSYDKNGTGTLSLVAFDALFKDLISGHANLGDAQVTDEILGAFRKFDTDNSGMIDVVELSAAFANMGMDLDRSKVTQLIQSFGDTKQLNLTQFAEAVHSFY